MYLLQRPGEPIVWDVVNEYVWQNAERCVEPSGCKRYTGVGVYFDEELRAISFKGNNFTLVEMEISNLVALIKGRDMDVNFLEHPETVLIATKKTLIKHEIMSGKNWKEMK